MRRRNQWARWILVAGMLLFAATATAGVIVLPGYVRDGVVHASGHQARPPAFEVFHAHLDIDSDPDRTHIVLQESVSIPVASLVHFAVWPLPADVVPGSVKLAADGAPLAGRFLDADAASTLYARLVSATDHPGFLKLTGPALLLPWVPARYGVVFRIEMTTRPRVTAGRLQIDAPMPSVQWARGAARKVTMTAKIRTKRRLRSVSSPTHGVEMERTSPTDATVRFAAESLGKSRPMRLVAPLSAKVIDEGPGVTPTP